MTTRAADAAGIAGVGPDARQPLRILGIAGSLRRESYNRRLLEAAQELAPAGTVVTIADLHGVPLYNADLDRDGERSEAVEGLRSDVASADALLFATPEYNHNVPGVLQNAIDWLSRPAMRSVLAGRPSGVVGAASGLLGAARAQQQLKLVLLSTLSPVMPHAGVAVGRAAAKFDQQGRLVDPATREFVAAYVEDLAEWATRFAPRAAAGRRRVA